VFYIQEGSVKASVVSKQGKEATITRLETGDFLGEGWIASDQPVCLSRTYVLAGSTIVPYFVTP
jgi:CRP-like cAMP-binding protein